MDDLGQRVVDFIAASPDKVRFAELVRHLNLPGGRAGVIQLKGIVADLVASGRLCYSCHYGSSFIERAYGRPCQISRHVVIKPPYTTWRPAPGQCLVELERGAAFGGGEHATTRMAIELIDDLLHHPAWRHKKRRLRGIDVGTGSGVLALVAAALGVGRVHAIDSDPCAVFEARHNVCLNRLEERISVAAGGLEALDDAYDIVIANLRTPTLFKLRRLVRKTRGGQRALVFSGLKTDEAAALCKWYREDGYRTHQNRDEKGWSAICLIRNALPSDSASCTQLH